MSLSSCRDYCRLSLSPRQARKWHFDLLNRDIALILDSVNTFTPTTTTNPSPVRSQPKRDVRADVLVAGAVAVDLNCDYTSQKAGQESPQLHTSNPASINQSVGGVGHNVALASHLASRQTKVKFCSMVGDDLYVCVDLTKS